MLFSSCEKDPGLAGNQQNDLLERIDSFSLTAYNQLNDVRDALNENDQLIGQLTDNRFGNSHTSFYSQIRLVQTGFTPGANVSLDSAYIQLELESTYGPLDLPMDLKVYRLEEALSSDNSYETDGELTIGTDVLAELNGYIYNEETFVKLPLSNAFANELLNLMGTSTLQNNDDLLSYLNGLYFTIDNSSGGDGLLDINIESTNTVLNLFFSSDVVTDSIFQFNMDAQSLKVNRYIHTTTASSLQNAIDADTKDDQLLYLGGLSLSKAIIPIPEINLPEGAIINQAFLRIYQADYGDPLNQGYDLPEFLFLSGGVEDDTIQYLLSDYNTADPSSYGGTFELTELNGQPTNVYTYNLPRFFQRVINEETVVEFLILESPLYNSGERVVLAGGSHPDLPIQLEILYTKP